MSKAEKKLTEELMRVKIELQQAKTDALLWRKRYEDLDRHILSCLV